MYSAAGEDYISFDTLEAWDGYVSWRNVLSGGYYIYSIADSTALELISPDSERAYAGGVHFNSPFLCWSEYSSGTGSSAAKFIILEPQAAPGRQLQGGYRAFRRQL